MYRYISPFDLDLYVKPNKFLVFFGLHQWLLQFSDMPFIFR